MNTIENQTQAQLERQDQQPPTEENFAIRVIRPEELDLMEQMEKDAHWGELKGEDRYFYESNPESFYCYELDGRVIGFLCGYAYSNQFGFLGNFIVDPNLRNIGCGKQLQLHVRSQMREVQQIGADGVLEMIPLYKKWGGFISHQVFAHLHDVQQDTPIADEETIFDLSQVEKQQVIDYDTQIFGVDRQKVLNIMFKVPEIQTKVYIKDGCIVGFGMIRKTMSDDWHLGPLSADNQEVAQQLFQALCNGKKGDKVIVVTEEKSHNGMELVKKFEMKQFFEATRIYKNDERLPHNYDKIYTNMSMAFN
eukprot:403356804